MIREATTSDASAIAHVHVDSWLQAYRGIVADSVLDQLSVPDRAERWVSILNTGEWPCFVAEAQSEIVGFVHVSDCRDTDLDSKEFGEITALYVSPNSWRLGVGSKLLNSALGRLKEFNFSYVTLWVLEQNKQARQFYEKHQFVVDGKSLHDKRLSASELRYCRKLQSVAEL